MMPATELIHWPLERRTGGIVANPTDEAIRATKIISLAKTIKRMRYNERQIVQVLRVNNEKAQAIMEGRLNGFSTAEITKMISVLD